jgi:hypothetical protein
MLEHAQLHLLFVALARKNGVELLRAVYQCVDHAGNTVGLNHQQAGLHALDAARTYRFEGCRDQSCNYWADQALKAADELLETAKDAAPSNIKVRATGHFSKAAGWLAKAAADSGSYDRYFDLLAKAISSACLCANLAQGHDSGEIPGPEDEWQEEFLMEMWSQAYCLANLDAPRLRTSLLAERAL